MFFDKFFYPKFVWTKNILITQNLLNLRFFEPKIFIGLKNFGMQFRVTGLVVVLGNYNGELRKNITNLFVIYLMSKIIINNLFSCSPLNCY